MTIFSFCGIFPLNSDFGGTMGFKNMKNNFTFADISLFNSMEKNRAIKRMELINVTVDWSRIESLLLRKYPVGKSFEGNDAYPPIVLMKGLLLQQWFKIDSDPELETQINDRISFKKYPGFLLMIPRWIISLPVVLEDNAL